MKKSDTIKRMCRELYRVSAITKNKELRNDAYIAAITLQWVVEKTSWNILTILQKFRSGN